jgi:hypothetical protein
MGDLIVAASLRPWFEFGKPILAPGFDMVQAPPPTRNRKDESSGCDRHYFTERFELND